jgi:hypothetical protein
MRYSINMSRHEIPAADGELDKEALEIQGSEVQGSDVQGSGRIIFSLAKILIDLIDDELTVSDAHKCAGKKVSMSKRAFRLVTGAANKTTNSPFLGRRCTYCGTLR